MVSEIVSAVFVIVQMMRRLATTGFMVDASFKD